jgi:hypothetical protein
MSSLNTRGATTGVALQSVAGVSLFGLACTSASSCLAVGQNSSGQDAVVPITNGVAGSPVAGADQVLPIGIACVSASSCVALGANDQFTEGVVVAINNGVPLDQIGDAQAGSACPKRPLPR